MSRSRTIVLLIALLLLAGLFAQEAIAQGLVRARARADISGGGNGINGTAHLVEDVKGNVWVFITVVGHPSILAPGRHGVHIHEVGACDPPGFTTAGGHFDPGPYGNSNTVTNHPYHVGDLENLEVNRNGVGRLNGVTARVSLSPGDASVFDANGSAIIIHQLEDQRRCQPDPVTGLCTGVSGGPRLACGVIEPDANDD